MPDIKLAAQPRDLKGNGPAKRLRKLGMIPAVVYGRTADSISVSVDPKDVLKIIHSETGENTIFELSIEGDKKANTVRIKDYQLDPLNFDLTHTDFIHVDMKQYVQVSVPVELIGIPKEVLSNEGILDQIFRDLEIKCLPGDIPPKIEIQVGEMVIGDNITVSDLELGDKIEIMNEPTATVAVLNVVKVEVEPVDEEEEGEGEGEGEDGAAEGETPESEGGEDES